MSFYDDIVKIAHENPGPVQKALLPIIKEHRSKSAYNPFEAFEGMSDDEFLEDLRRTPEPDPEQEIQHVLSMAQMNGYDALRAFKHNNSNRMRWVSNLGTWARAMTVKKPTVWRFELVSQANMNRLKSVGAFLPPTTPAELWFSTSWGPDGRYYTGVGMKTVDGRNRYFFNNKRNPLESISHVEDILKKKFAPILKGMH